MTAGFPAPDDLGAFGNAVGFAEIGDLHQCGFPRGNDDLIDGIRLLQGRQRPHQHRHAVQKFHQLIHAAHAGGAACRRHQRRTVRAVDLSDFLKQGTHGFHPF